MIISITPEYSPLPNFSITKISIDTSLPSRFKHTRTRQLLALSSSTTSVTRHHSSHNPFFSALDSKNLFKESIQILLFLFPSLSPPLSGGAGPTGSHSAHASADRKQAWLVSLSRRSPVARNPCGRRTPLPR